MATTRRKFTAEFKREAVRLTRESGLSKSQVARDLGLHLNVLRKWIQQFESGRWEAAAGAPLKSAQQQEVERLKRELRRVTMERDILKKAVGYFAKEPQ
jgi:transposase